ncbi:MAG: sensor histidine kinase [Phycisphaerae bacterium]
MVPHATTRRNAIVLLTLIGILVCGGLGWATRSAVRLRRIQARTAEVEARAAHEKSYDEIRALAMTRLDGLIESRLGPERTRSTDIFRSFFKPPRAYDSADGSEVHDSVLLPSPLQNLGDQDWILLHFQASFTRGWSSPQLEDGAELAVPASAIPAAERRRHASAANWLAALRERYDPLKLQELLEEAQQAYFLKIRAYTPSATDVRRRAAPTASSVEPPDSRTAAEFARRGARLIELQREHAPQGVCEPQLVVMENLQTSEDLITVPEGGDGCVQVERTPMYPLWLDVTLDGRRQLALVRSVSVERYTYCTLQGVLIDWERFREILEAEVRDLLPGARIEPVAIGTPPDPRTTLHTIPARLVSTMPAFEGPPPPPGGLGWGLAMVWGVTLLALAAIFYGTMKYVTLAERRMRFVAAVTHELRSPLTSFQLYTDLLADGNGGDAEERVRYVATLRKEAQRLGRLVENVLSYSQIVSARPQLRPEPIAPQQILDTLAAQSRECCRAAGKRLVIENRCPQDTRLETDVEFVVQILSNLIENACKYSAGVSDPRVWLVASPTPDGGVTFEVEDAGPGVAQRDRKAVFKPFRRGDAEREGPGTGLGLGLALSRHWAACLGGRLQLKRSERNGAHYSRFSLRLPRSA